MHRTKTHLFSNHVHVTNRMLALILPCYGMLIVGANRSITLIH